MPTLLAIVVLVILASLLPRIPDETWAGAVVIVVFVAVTCLSWYIMYKVLEKILKIALKIKD